MSKKSAEELQQALESQGYDVQIRKEWKGDMVSVQARKRAEYFEQFGSFLNAISERGSHA